MDKDGRWRFGPALTSRPSMEDISHPLDAFMDIKGKPLVHTSRRNLRTFDKAEIKRVLNVGLCLACHKDFSDPVMKGWTTLNQPTPCIEGKKLLKNDKKR